MDALDVAASIVTIHESGIFDAAWYRRTYGWDDAIAGGALVHYCVAGWKRGLRPCFLFDPEHYCQADPALRDAPDNPLLHYLRQGDAEGRRASVHFDAGWYRRAHALPPGENALVHYLRHRAQHRHRPHPGFDPAWYVAQNDDVAAHGLDPYEHYVCHGAGEGRAPSADALAVRDAGLFDAARYRALCPDLARDGTDPLLHFAGRPWRDRAAANPVFDAGYYRAANGDVAERGLDPLLHYARFGEAEARRPAAWFDPLRYRRAYGLPDTANALGDFLRRLDPPDTETTDPEATGTEATEIEAVRRSGLFDANFYLITYPDVREVGVDPLVHFTSDGEKEGRWPNPYFDPAWYAATTGLDPARTSLLLHYVRLGEKAGCRPVPYFDPVWYRASHDPPGGRSLAHYLSVRRAQTHGPVALFDLAWYLRRHQAEIGRNRDAFAHYLRTGIDTDQDPGPEFDAGAYRRAHMTGRTTITTGSPIGAKAVREARNPLVHFLRREYEAAGAAPSRRAGDRRKARPDPDQDQHQDQDQDQAGYETTDAGTVR